MRITSLLFKAALVFFIVGVNFYTLSGQFDCYQDLDGDSYGAGPVINSPVLCHLGTNLSTFDGDCDDTNPLINPGEPEWCDGLDNDCDGVADSSPGASQPIVLNSQTDVNNFWLMGCSGITGDLVIETTDPTDPITDLTFLGFIFQIEGSLIIRNNNFLLDDQLFALGQSGGILGGSLIIENNDLFDSLDNINIYDPILGDLIIKGNDGLNDIYINGFPPSTIGGDLKISDNPSLSTLNSLETISSIGGNVEIVDNAQLSFCHITPICDHLTSGGTATISGNLGDCLDLPTVTALCDGDCPVGDLVFNSQAEVDAFIGCSKVTGSVTIYSTDLSDPITDLSPLDPVEEITGTLWITDNSHLTNISAFPNLTSLFQFNVFNNSNLCCFELLGPLNNGLINFNNNPDLTEITGFPNLEIADWLLLVNNPLLADISGFSGLKQVVTQLNLDNLGITDVSGLASLETVTDFLLVIDNSVLQSLNGLDNFTLTGNLWIENNINLTDISSISGLDVSTSIDIEDNSQLDFCHIQSVCDHIDNGGTISISGNATNCVDVATVSGFCDGDCPVGDLIFNSQEEIDAFSGCINVTGDVIIDDDGSGSAITDLSPLDVLETITGDLILVNNPSLGSFDNFNSLISVNDVRITNNDAVVQIEGFQGLTNFNWLHINKNDALVDILAFNNLTILKDFSLIENHALKNINGFSSLQSMDVGGFLVFQSNGLENVLGLSALIEVKGDLELSLNSQLTSLAGLENLISAGTASTDELRLQGNFALTDISALDNLQSVQELRIVQCHGLGSINGFSGLTSAVDIGISANNSIVEIKGFQNLNSTDNLNISSNSSLVDIQGFENMNFSNDLNISFNSQLDYCHIQSVCDHITNGGTITISNNNTNCLDVATVTILCTGDCPIGDLVFNSQEEVNAFVGCTEVIGDVIVKDNGSGSPITDLSPLFTLEKIQGKLVVQGNPQLLSVSGFSNLTTLETFWAIDNPMLNSISGLNAVVNMIQISIRNNPNLLSITGLSALESTGNLIELINNIALIDLSGWNNLTTASGSPGLFLIENNGLTDLSFLSSLEHVEGDFRILNNPDLLNLDHLGALQTMGGNSTLEIRDNPVLSSIGGFNTFNSSITSSGSSVFILQNPNLMTVSGFTSLTESRSISFNSNSSLTAISGFTSLKECNVLNISNAPALQDFGGVGGGFSDLEKIYLYLSIAITGLQDLMNFASIDEIIQRVDLTGNSMLSNIQALDLTVLPNEINIWSNPLLDVCNISSICNVIQNDPSLVTIHSNSTNCIDITTIMLQCEDAMPVIDGTTDACITVGTVDISAAAGNNNQWVQVSDGSGNILCSINANGNDLGLTEFKVFQSSNPRTAGLPYMNRDVTISPANQPTTDVSVRIYYTAAEFAALQAADPTIMSIADVDFTKTSTDCSGMFTGMGQFIPQTASGTYGSLGDVFVQGEVGSFSTFFANGQDQALSGVVPIELLSFSAKAKGDNVELSWTTTLEINSSRFEIQYAAQKDDFTWVSEVAAHGFTEIESEYNYLHKFPRSGNNYYRLKLIDMDGSYSYSETINIRMEAEELTIYPNPVRDKIYVQGVDEAVDFMIYDQIGRIMSRGRVEEKEPIDMQDLVKGIYQLVIKENGRIQNFSIVKI